MQPCWRNLVHKACGQSAHGPPISAPGFDGQGPKTVVRGGVVAGLGAPLGERGYIENAGASSGLQPGEWALEGETAYYALRPGESATSVRAVLPTLQVLLQVSGASGLAFANECIKRKP